jgi:predicted nucleic acid-binding Zn ribbon protein
MTGETWFWALLVAVFIGAIPAFIAESKGRNFVAWWFLGTALFIVALPASLLIKPQETRVEAGKCPFCGHLVRTDATVCTHCARDLPTSQARVREAVPEDLSNKSSNPPFCGQCGLALPIGSKFCNECGGAVVRAVDFVNKARFCGQCGAGLPPGSRFCNACGACFANV